MSMQVDFVHPCQLEDLKAVRRAIQQFTDNMSRMMLLMKDLGTTLEKVSQSFAALTSLSFTDQQVKRYVRHFADEVTLMKEGVAFQNYNRYVHEEVLQPVKDLKKVLKTTEAAAEQQKKAYASYEKSKRVVDHQETAFASKRRPLTSSQSYPKNIQKRNTQLEKYQQKKTAFDDGFESFVAEVEHVTTTAMKRYLHLNAGYMSAVIEALTSTDPSVHEAIAVYQMEYQQMRRDAALGGRANDDSEETRTERRQVHESTNGVLRNSVRSNGTAGGASHSCTLPSSTDCRGADRGSPLPSAAPAAALAGPPTAATANGAGAAANRPAASSSAALQAESGLPMAGGGGTGASNFHYHDPNSPSRRSMDDLENDDFGSASQYGGEAAVAGRTNGGLPPPLYNFGRGPYSQVSSVAPRAGYVSAENTALTNHFLRQMDGYKANV